MHRRSATRYVFTGFVAACLAVLGPLAARGQQPEDTLATPAVRHAMEQLRPEGIRAHVRYLSDDLLEGRDTGSRGGNLAARYIASQFEQLGLKPAGDGGSYFQQVPFVRRRVDLAASHLSPGDDGPALQGGKDFLPALGTRAAVKLEAPAVFAGYGITAPEFQYDDYKGLDVKGRVVVLLAGEPASQDPAFFDGPRDTKYASATAKAALARAKGAVGVIGIRPGTQDLAAWDRLGGFLGAARVTLPESESRAELPQVTLRPEAAPRLFEGAPESWADVVRDAPAGKVRSFALPRKVSLEVAVEQAPLPGSNVAGLLEGSDPELKKQVVLYTAHYDHVGQRSGGQGDTIYNGAWDNASGTAEVLEIARAFSAMQPRPRRSILFLLVTGEEKGLLGSRYYTEHPLVPLEDTAADINMDMTEIFGIPKEIVAQGAERNTLLLSAKAVARELGLKLGEDPTPELHVFNRSDQFSFARVGVPCVFMRWANEYEDLAPDEAKARAKEKLDKIYHQVTDGFDPSWSWEGMRRHAQQAFLLGVHVAAQPEMPRWNPGDEFDHPRGVAPSGQ